MSTSTSALGRTAHSRKSSRKVIPNHILGSTAIAGLVLGCAWTVYANIFAASVYPQLSSANYDAPVIRRTSTVVARSAPPVVNNVVAALSESAPLISAPATVPPGPSLSFQDRFAAAAPQGVEPKPQAEAPKLAEAPK